jgi:hypothetical protein
MVTVAGSCPNGGIRLDGSYKASLAAAYADSAIKPADNTMEFHAGSLPDAGFDFGGDGRDVMAVFKGGYDCSYVQRAMGTVLSGGLTISNGTLVAEYLILQ